MTNGFGYHLAPRLNIEKMLNHPNIAVIGLGYVGQPLAVEFGKKFVTTGFDLSTNKIANYQATRDSSADISGDELRRTQPLTLTNDPALLADADFLILAVPTPVDAAHLPGLSSPASASEAVGKYLKHGATVIYESTVYPGTTELVRELRDFGYEVWGHAPVAIPEEAHQEYGIGLTAWNTLPQTDVIVTADGHREYREMAQEELLAKHQPGGAFGDVKSVHEATEIQAAGFHP